MQESNKKIRICERIKLIFQTVLLSGVISVLLISYPAFANSNDVILSMSYGYQNVAGAGELLPVKVRVINDSDEDITGKLEIELENEDREGNVIYSFDVKVPSCSENEIKTTVTISDESEENQVIGLRLFDENGELIAERHNKIEIQGSGMQLMAGVLSGFPDRLIYLRGTTPAGSALRVKTISLNQSDMPETAEGYEQLDMIVISGYNTSNLDEGVVAAVSEWVKSGGILLLGTGEVENPLGAFSEILPDTILGQADIREVNMGLNYSTDGPDGATETLFVRDVFDPHGIEAMQTDDIAMLTTIKTGEGVIGITSYDLCEITDFCTEHINYTEDLLTALIGKTRLKNISDTRAMGINRYEMTKPLVNIANISKMPKATLYVVIAFIYVFAVGIGAYAVLKNRGLSIYYPIVVVISAFVFGLIIFIVSSFSKFRYPSISYASIKEKRGEDVDRTVFIEMFSADGKEIKLSLDSNSTIHPIGECERTGIIEIENTDSDKVVSYYNSRPFEKRILSISDKEKSEEALETGIRFYEEKLSGKVKNLSAKDMEDVVLFLDGAVVSLGNINSGEEIDLSETTVNIIPPDEDEYIIEKLTQSNGIKDIAKSRLLSYYIANRQLADTDTGKIIAFIDDKDEVVSHDNNTEDDNKPDSSITVLDQRVISGGCTLFAENVDVNRRSGEKIYRSAMGTEPKIVSGTYDYSENSIEGSTTVLEYSLGSDINIDSVRFSYFAETENRINISIYNYTEGAYDSINSKKTTINRAELSSYLSPSNTILIRYFPEEELDQNESLRLPMLSVTGVPRQ